MQNFNVTYDIGELSTDFGCLWISHPIFDLTQRVEVCYSSESVEQVSASPFALCKKVMLGDVR